ncbi:pyridoxal phosphate-dependent transferase [Chaetomium sp. MPI-SDFR-AT-0129]|nr:pyridoxal phosphate-dependent transferase [Chaetomium sp. MPI-SDFR-AT-0129]
MTPDSHRRVRPAGTEKPAPLDLTHHYSAVTKRRVPSKIKEVYKFFGIPNILNLAGGLPHVDYFPFDTLEAQTAKPERWTPTPNYPGEKTAVSSSSSSPTSSSGPASAAHIVVPKFVKEDDPLKKVDLDTVLQYGLAPGYPPLLSWVRQFVRENLEHTTLYKGGPGVVLTCGATDGFSKCLDLFVDQWTEGVNPVSTRPGILCEPYIYNSILSQAEPHGVQFVTVNTDVAGMVATGPGGLEDVLANWDPSKGKRPHLLYTVTLGHNPTGVVLSVERKKELYAVCSKYDVVIIEDEPYWYLQFPSASIEEAKSRGLPIPQQQSSKYSPPKSTSSSSGYAFLDSLTPSFIALDTDGRVVRLDTFSKTVAPGCRLGWITAQPALIERFERINESTTQQPSGFTQGLITELVLGPHQTSNSKATIKNQQARSAFARLRTTRDRAAFSGWDTSGWVRWLEGLRGNYERRMVRMCRALDAGSTLITTTTTYDDGDGDSEWDAVTVTTTPLYTYSWPRGGMFVWLRMLFQSHPLWNHPDVDGPTLARALQVWLTRKPFLVLVGSGTMFSATTKVEREEGWTFYRLCFAAEAEDNIGLSGERFGEGVKAFWEVKDVGVIRKLLSEVALEEGEEGVSQLASYMGC